MPLSSNNRKGQFFDNRDYFTPQYSSMAIIYTCIYNVQGVSSLRSLIDVGSPSGRGNGCGLQRYHGNHMYSRKCIILCSHTYNQINY